MGNMKILVDKTIEEMAEEGYRPILNPGILRRREITPENVGSLSEENGSLLMKTLKNAYQGNPLVSQIEAIVVRVGLTRTDSEGNIFSTPPYFGEGKEKRFLYPMLAYIKD